MYEIQYTARMSEYHSYPYCQQYMEVEFLPAYYPSAAEKADPILYANNVRAAMGRALNVPLSEMGNEDWILAYYVCSNMTKSPNNNPWLMLQEHADVVVLNKARLASHATQGEMGVFLHLFRAATGDNAVCGPANFTKL